MMTHFVIAFVGYTTVTMLLFRGLIGRFSVAVPSDLGDPLLSTWLLWWNAHRFPFVGAWWDGLSFYPAPGSLAFSDHRVGLTLIAGPVQWLGGSPVIAYNVTLLSTFVLCALAAHALTWWLTRSHAAGAVAGLIFGFNPFRLSHISHLELLAVFWLPLAFLALHLYVRRYQARWLVVFAVCWLFQGLSSGYYLFYSAPVIGLWALWFARDEPVRGVGAIVLACGAVFLALLPVLLGYQRIQNELQLRRSSAEIEFFSADLAGILSATPNIALWRVPSLVVNGEAEIYLGIFAPLLILAAILQRRSRTSSGTPVGWRRFRLGVAIVGAIYATIAAGTLIGPWAVTLGPLTVSASQTAQPLTVAVFCVFVLGLTSAAVVDAFRRRSVFAFYTMAAFVSWTFTWGPRPTLLGHQLLYRGPYAFLMLFPGFDERLRVPARFVMLTILAVGVAAGIALVRLTGSTSRFVRAAITAVVLLAIAADSWMPAIPMPHVPALVQLPAPVPSSAVVLELPLGNLGPDIAAVYRSIAHERHVVNGYSGYEPRHYRVLRAALGERDDSALITLTKFAPLAVIIARVDDPGGGLAEFVERQPGAKRLEATASRTVYLLPKAAEQAAAQTFGASLPIRSATFNLGAFNLRAVTDGDWETHWATPKPQGGREELVLELTDEENVSGISVSTGPPLEGYPRGLAVDTSADGSRWDEQWSGATAGLTAERMLEDPVEADTRIGFSPTRARFVRLRQLDAHPEIGWFIAELKIYR
jgi:hypothetical protein